MFDRNRTPWDKIGTNVKLCTDLEHVITEAQLDFTVSKSPIKYHGAKNDLQTLPDKFITFREDTDHPFGIVGARYTIIQNQEAFDWLQLMYNNRELEYETAGMFDKGSKVFISTRVPGGIRLPGDDEIRKYMLFSTTHDGTGSINILFTGIRVVCQNTLQLALQDAKSGFSIKHTRNAKDKLALTRRVIAEQHNYFEQLTDFLLKLSRIRVGEDVIEKILAYVFLSDAMYAVYTAEKLPIFKNYSLPSKVKDTMREIYSALENGIGQQYHKGSALWLYNGITTYTHNHKRYELESDRVDDLMENKIGNKISYALHSLLK